MTYTELFLGGWYDVAGENRAGDDLIAAQFTR